MRITLCTLCTYIILFANLRQDENGSDGDDRKGDDSRGFWWFYTADIVAGHANISWPHFPVSPSELRIRNRWFLIFVMNPDHKLKFKSKSWIQILLDLQYRYNFPGTGSRCKVFKAAYKISQRICTYPLSSSMGKRRRLNVAQQGSHFVWASTKIITFEIRGSFSIVRLRQSSTHDCCSQVSNWFFCLSSLNTIIFLSLMLIRHLCL